TPSAAATANHELQTREARGAQRERQLVEQQRILEEEYRLLRRHAEPAPAPAAQEPVRSAWTPPPASVSQTIPSASTSAVAVDHAMAPGVRQPPAPANGTGVARPAPVRTPASAVRVASPGVRYSAAARLRREPPPSESMWARLRRGLF